MVDLSKLEHRIPKQVMAELPDTMAKFNINTPLRLAHFLSQCAHESGNFNATRENLNYSADRLRVVFPKYFPTPEVAQQYARNQVKIGSRVYANRMGNGDEKSEEGYKFRGRGYIQLTGKSNYQAFDKFVPDNIVMEPELVASKYPLMSAAWFFDKNNLWAICDLGATEDVVKNLTKRINGGLNGLDDRLKKFKLFYGFLTN